MTNKKSKNTKMLTPKEVLNNIGIRKKISDGYYVENFKHTYENDIPALLELMNSLKRDYSSLSEIPNWKKQSISLKFGVFFCDSLNAHTELLQLQDNDWGVWTASATPAQAEQKEEMQFSLHVKIKSGGFDFDIHLTFTLTDISCNVLTEKRSSPYRESPNRDLFSFNQHDTKPLTTVFAGLHTMVNRMRDEEDAYQISIDVNAWWVANSDQHIKVLAQRSGIKMSSAYARNATAIASSVKKVPREELPEKVLELYNSGLNISEVCKRVGWSYSQIKHIVTLNRSKVDKNIIRPNVRSLNETTKQIIELLKKGLPQIAVAKKLKVSRQRVNYVDKKFVKGEGLKTK